MRLADTILVGISDHYLLAGSILILYRNRSIEGLYRTIRHFGRNTRNRHTGNCRRTREGRQYEWTGCVVAVAGFVELVIQLVRCSAIGGQAAQSDFLGLLRFVQFDILIIIIQCSGGECPKSFLVIIHPYEQVAVLIRKCKVERQIESRLVACLDIIRHSHRSYGRLGQRRCSEALGFAQVFGQVARTVTVTFHTHRMVTSK